MSNNKPNNKFKKILSQPWILYLILGVSIVLLVKVIDINVYPYKLLLKGTAEPETSSLRNVFVIGWLIQKLDLFQADLMALLAYVFVQFFELLPKIIESDKDLVRSLLSQANSAVSVNEGDKPVIKKLKKALVPVGLLFKAFADSIRVIAYIVDAFICYAGYPFFTGVDRLYEFDKIGDIIAFGQFDKINTGNLIFFALTVYGVEFLLENIIGILSLIQLKRKVRSA